MLVRCVDAKMRWGGGRPFNLLLAVVYKAQGMHAGRNAHCFENETMIRVSREYRVRGSKSVRGYVPGSDDLREVTVRRETCRVFQQLQERSYISWPSTAT